MPSQPYNLVKDDPDSLRVPLHPDEAFYTGISFQAKVCWIFSYLHWLVEIFSDSHENVDNFGFFWLLWITHYNENPAAHD